MTADRAHAVTSTQFENVHFQTTRNGGSGPTSGVITEHSGNFRDLKSQASRSKSLPIDLFAAALVPFLTIWLYEASNWVVLAVQGYSVSLSTAGWLPLGVAGVSSGGLSPLTKVLQIALAVGLLLPLGKLFSNARLWIAEAFIISSMGIFLASAYWEMLTILTVLPMAIHTGIFIAGTSATVLVLLHISHVGRLHPVRNTLSATSSRKSALH